MGKNKQPIWTVRVLFNYEPAKNLPNTGCAFQCSPAEGAQRPHRVAIVRVKREKPILDYVPVYLDKDRKNVHRTAWWIVLNKEPGTLTWFAIRDPRPY